MVHDLLLLGVGVVVSSVVSSVLMLLRRGARNELAMVNEHRPPPAGHQAVLAVGARTMTCSCGWLCTLAWPSTSRRTNRARLNHYFAVDQQHVAQRLGVDAESMLDRVLAAHGTVRPIQEVPRLGPGQNAGPREADTAWPRRLEPARNRRLAAEARRASAIARVEAGRVMAKYSGESG